MDNKKLTIVEKYEAVMALLRGETPAVDFTAEDAEVFLLDRKEQTIKKNAKTGDRKLTPTQIENEAFKTAIIEAFASIDKAVTVGDFTKAVPAFADKSSQKMTSLFNQLCAEGRLVRETVKGRNFYSLPKED